MSSQSDFSAKMSAIGYTRGWLELGIVDARMIDHQFDVLNASDGTSAEHLRHRAFTAWLDGTTELTDHELSLTLALADAGPDGNDMRKHRFLELVRSNKLSDEQFGRLDQLPLGKEDDCARILLRFGVLRTLGNTCMTEEQFSRVKTSNDSILHRAVLERAKLTNRQLAWLNEQGGSKAVRNMARQALEAKKSGPDR